MSRTWSHQQDAIFSWFEDPSGRMRGLGPATDGKPTHLVVVARAGTGKTTTIVEGVSRAPEGRILLAAFNKRIADELNTRLTGGAEAKTLHAIGRMIVVKYWEGIRVENTKDRTIMSRKDALTERICGQRVPDAIKRLVSKLHTLGREINPLAKTGAELVQLAEDFDCVPDEQWEAEGYDVERVAGYAIQAMALAANEKPRNGIDFADMIYLPIVNGWINPYYDLVVVDEGQDMTAAQLMLAQGVCRGRIAIVGDDRQAIYGFRGADSGSLGRLRDELNAMELGLTTTYRCGRIIVDAAAQLVPDFQAAPSNPEGVITSLHTSKLADAAQPGDFILSRTNAPLVETAMQILKQGKRTKVAGKDIGTGLLTLVRKISGKARSVPEFLDRLAGWQTRELARATKARATKARADEKKIDAIMDRADMLRAVADDAPNVASIATKIESLFTDDGLGQAGVVTCSSVHRAKGLEAERVFVLQDTLKSTTIEEQNIQYVAITRARRELVWVSDSIATAVKGQAA